MNLRHHFHLFWTINSLPNWLWLSKLNVLSATNHHLLVGILILAHAAKFVVAIFQEHMEVLVLQLVLLQDLEVLKVLRPDLNTKSFFNALVLLFEIVSIERSDDGIKQNDNQEEDATKFSEKAEELNQCLVGGRGSVNWSGCGWDWLLCNLVCMDIYLWGKLERKTIKYWRISINATSAGKDLTHLEERPLILCCINIVLP